MVHWYFSSDCLPIVGIVLFKGRDKSDVDVYQSMVANARPIAKLVAAFAFNELEFDQITPY